ncbi:type VII secretion integral membrane protein EccD [Streptomyces sp. AC627_RSS907]|uniref:type VII secretion integral membrane protein EccD n=1 Tax=Streptomyces sp. AC627_RSS907 TaxID=2823684 RepID=UPI0027E47D97|nr:type VII secretion integral membrane protein EccD [Streptomyces sp. AC627_RSS907]
MSDKTAGLCRITIRSPEKTFELGIPVDVPLADLLPVLVEYAGGDLDEQGLDHGGWSLQRLGAAPLDEERTPAALELRDGETLYLRARHESLPEVVYDDLVDGIGESLRARSDTWRPELTRRLLLGFTVVALAVGLITVLLPGQAVWRAAAAAVFASLLVAGALAASRAVGDAGAGAVLGVLAVPYLAVAGALVPVAGYGEDMLGPRLLAGGAAGAGAAIVALAAVGAFAPLFLGAFTVAVFTVAAGAVALAGMSIAQVAGWLAVTTVLAGGFVPSLCFRLAGMRMPPLPSNAGELQEGIEPFPAQQVRERAELADRYLTGMYTALGLVAAACETALLTAGDGWTPPLLAVVLSTLLLLHVRVVGAVWHRLAMAVPGAYGIALAAVVRATDLGLPERLEVAVAVAVLAAVTAIAAWTVPGRRLVPYWGRFADILHTLCALMLLPLAVLLAGVFGALRGIRG